MKIKYLIIILASLSLNAFAETPTDDTPPCEADKPLPQGYRYAIITSDCVYNENLTPVIKDGLYGYANNQGKIKIPAKYQLADGFDDGLALVKFKDKYGFINAKGNLVIKARYDDAWGFSDKRAKVVKNGKILLIDTQGKTLKTPKISDSDHWYSSGLLAVKSGEQGKQNGKWGYLDTQGKVAIDFTYDKADGFSEGIANVGKTDSQGVMRYGYIDRQGIQVIPLTYTTPSAFMNGVANVVDDKGKFILIDTQGKPITTNETANQQKENP